MIYMNGFSEKKLQNLIGKEQKYTKRKDKNIG